MTEDIAHLDRRNLLVIAPPGCGKTELLARRADYLIPFLGQNQKILALTFSNKAKANLNERLTKVLGGERKRRFVTVRNFHGHAAEVVLAHGRTLGIDVDSEMPTKELQAGIIDRAVEDISGNAKYDAIGLIEEELGAVKRRPICDADVLSLLQDADTRTRQVESDRQRGGIWFYDDLLREAQRLLRVAEIARLYRGHYGAVLVDEFQDLSPQQLDIALRTCDLSRTFVGDPLQGIYSWTGARPIEVERSLRRISGDPLGLGVSYRSSPKVLGLLGIISKELGGQPLQAHDRDTWFEGGVAAGTSFETGEEEAEFIERTCAAILQGDPEATIGIICRSGWRRKLIDKCFALSSLSCTRWDLAMDDGRITDLIRQSASRLGGNPSFDELVSDVANLVEYSDTETVEALGVALESFADIVDDVGSVISGLAQLRVLDDLEAVVTPGVHLLNAHTGKGQQFDWVFIPGMEKGNMPSFKAKGNKAALLEEKRVLLVILSRARHGVVLTRSRTLVSKRGKIYSPDPCPWLPSLRAGLTAGRRDLLTHIDKLSASKASDLIQAASFE